MKWKLAKIQTKVNIKVSLSVSSLIAKKKKDINSMPNNGKLIRRWYVCSWNSLQPLKVVFMMKLGKQYVNMVFFSKREIRKWTSAMISTLLKEGVS